MVLLEVHWKGFPMSGTNVDRGQDAPRPTTPPPTPATGTVERNVLFIASIAAPLCTMGLEFYTWTRWHSVSPEPPSAMWLDMARS